MSPALQAELILQTNGYWLSAIKLLRTPESDDAPEVPTLPASDSFSSKSRRASARKSMYAKAAQHGLQTTYLPTEGLTEAQRLHRCFLVEVSLGLIPVVFAPGESVSQNYVTVITNGIALLNGSKILHEGSAVGQDSLLSAKWLRKQDTAVAINYLHVYMIGPQEIKAIANRHPTAKAILRQRIAYLALRRELTRLAAFVRAEKAIMSKLDERRDRDSARNFDERSSAPHRGSLVAVMKRKAADEAPTAHGQQDVHQSLTLVQSLVMTQETLNANQSAQTNLAYSKSKSEDVLKDKLEHLEREQHSFRSDINERLDAMQACLARLIPPGAESGKAQGQGAESSGPMMLAA